MAIDFPNSPTNGQTYSVGDKMWTYNSADNKWLLSSVSPDSGTLTTKGDLLTRSSSAITRLGAGSNGDLLIADSEATEGLRWQSQSNTGRNAIINGGFDVWQRGTSFAHAASGYTADRFLQVVATAVPSGTVSRQAFTAGSAPQSPYEGTYFMRVNITANNGCTIYDLEERIEDVRTFANQTVTLSFWAKADATINLPIYIGQNFGSGGSSETLVSGTVTLTTSWQRFTLTATLGSMAGKTIGTNSYVRVVFRMPLSGSTIRNGTYDFWGVQVEQGSVATRFEELPYADTLRKCQRYYYLHVSGTTKTICTGNNFSATSANGQVFFPVTMRTAPTLTATSGTDYYAFARNGADDLFNSLTIERSGENAATVGNSAQISGTAGQAGYFFTNNASASVAFSAEL